MALFASWSPGTAFMPAEFPSDTDQVNSIGWTNVVGLRQSGGATFKGKNGTSNWFHVPIATPVIINDTRVTLAQVWLMFLAGDPTATLASNAGTTITDVHVWDGPNRIHMFGGFHLFGEHRFKLTSTSVLFKMPTGTQVFFGLELAVHVSFDKDMTVTFASAGADFIV